MAVKGRQLIIVLAAVAVIGIWFCQWRAKHDLQPRDAPRVLMLGDVCDNLDALDGKKVRVICYFQSDLLGSGSVADSLDAYTESEIAGRKRLLMLTREAAPLLPATSGLPKYFHERGMHYLETPVLLEGVVHRSGYQKEGMLLADEPYIETLRVWKIKNITAEKPIDEGELP